MSPPPMPHSTRSSSGSAHCRIEWRPSRWLLAALALLVIVAPVAVFASALPAALAWPLAIAALLQGLRQVVRHARRPMRVVELQAGPGDGSITTRVDGATVAGALVAWRGPLAVLSWRTPGGGWECLSWWPDTLPPASRRELRLAAPGSRATAAPASMAP